jgi:uncharacterized membrane protein
LPFGVNNQGQITGEFLAPSGQAHGYLYDAGTFHILAPPGSTQTLPSDLNNSGQVVGTILDGSRLRGFVYHDGDFHILDAPGSRHTSAFAINDLGDVAGDFVDVTGDYQGFLYSGGRV